MGIAEILALIIGVLRFPKEVTTLVRLLSKTTEERRQEIRGRMAEELKAYENSGRPEWE